MLSEIRQQVRRNDMLLVLVACNVLAIASISLVNLRHVDKQYREFSNLYFDIRPGMERAEVRAILTPFGEPAIAHHVPISTSSITDQFDIFRVRASHYPADFLAIGYRGELVVEKYVYNADMVVFGNEFRVLENPNLFALGKGTHLMFLLLDVSVLLALEFGLASIAVGVIGVLLRRLPALVLIGIGGACSIYVLALYPFSVTCTFLIDLLLM
jgi:hypothetical protein